MTRHEERVAQLLARGDLEGAKYAHNSAVVRAKLAARSGTNLRRKLPGFRRAKALLDAHKQ